MIRRHARRMRRRAYRVTIDLDPTDDPTHGAQQLSFFNGHYDTWCYLPVLGFVSFNDEAEQYLCAAVLRPGNVTAAVGAVALLRRLVGMIRRHLPGVRIRVRLDGGFAHPAVLEFLDAQPRLEYVVAMAKNAVLKRVAETGMRRARRLSRRSGQTEHIYGEVRYAARKWPRLRRIIIKAEVVRAADKDPKDNPRFVITNLKQSSQWIYEHVYCPRGDIENRIKELHELEIDRTSCTSFWANQFRVLLTAAAYVLMQELRLHAAHTSCARAQVWMLRERLLKLGARIVGSVSPPGRASARVVSVCGYVPASGAGTGRSHRLNLFLQSYELNANPHRQRPRHPCLSILQLERPDLGTLRFLRSTNPNLPDHNPLSATNPG